MLNGEDLQEPENKDRYVVYEHVKYKCGTLSYRVFKYSKKIYIYHKLLRFVKRVPFRCIYIFRNGLVIP